MLVTEADLLQYKDEMVRLRREFHQYPEPGFRESRTSAMVAKYLTALGLEVQTRVGKTGVVGLLRGSGAGPTLMLRADMDALPIEEQNDLPHKSRNPGMMHACGHDGHMAILLTVARFLRERRGSLSGNVKFVFQPGEEGYAGARSMIEEGVLEHPAVDAALGLHLMSDLPVGTVGIRPGPLMASMDTFTITVLGRGGHAATPEKGVDAITMASHLKGLVHPLHSPVFDMDEDALVSGTSIMAGLALGYLGPAYDTVSKGPKR